MIPQMTALGKHIPQVTVKGFSARPAPRSAGLPSGIDKDKTSATFKKGVLKVTLPKTVRAQKEVMKLEIKKEEP